MKRLVIIACLFLLWQACKKPKTIIIDGIEMVRSQTQCADVWGYGSTNDSTITLLKKYLLSKQVPASKITMQANGGEVFCLACPCKRGFDFHVWVDNMYTDSLAKEGFTVK